MSNFIPMVSASPPPFDDHSFGYDDDDDFGNFTGAGDSHESSPDPPELPPPIEADHTDSTDVVKENIKNNNPLSEKQTNISTNENANGFHQQDVNSTNTLVNGIEEESDFADFEQYDDNPEIDVSSKKPHIENLPIQTSCENTPITISNHELKDLHESKDSLSVQSETSPDNGSCDSRSPTCDDKDTVPTSVKASRDSTTDSGMFSTDISPVPKSEDTAEFCDKSCESDNDDTFPELPRDKIESTDNDSVCESCVPKAPVDSDVIANETRTSLGLDTCSSTDDCVSEDSREENSCLSHTKVEEEDTIHNKDDQTVSCSSTDQQVSPLDSRDNSQALSEQNEKSSQDVSLGHVESSGQIEDEDDWGDFDSADDGLQGEDSGMTQDQASEKEQSQVDEDCVSGTSSAIADVQSEDECLEAIEEALKDSTNTGSADLDEPDQLEVNIDIDAEIPKSTSGVSIEKDETSDSSQLQADSEPSQVECCDVIDERTESDIDSKEHNEFTEENVCTDDISVPCDTQVEESDGFVAAEDGWNAFGEFSDTADGDDNWANFQSTSHDPTPGEPKPMEDEDFGDFNTAQDSKKEEEGDFGGFTSVSDKDTADADGDWANFEDCKSTANQTSQIPSKLPVPDTTASLSAPHSKVSSEKLDHILSSCFPSLDSGETETCPSQLEVLISAQPDKGTVSMHISKTTTGKARGPGVVWHSLRDLDKTSALVYQWTSSTANKHMFKTLRIDTQNILIGHKKQSVPIFASNIGLLEPIRGPVDAKPLQPKLNPTLVDPDKADDNAGGAQELPPVEFDWDNSGLTNPLTAEERSKMKAVNGENPVQPINSSMSKTLDLDFLSVQETENVNKNTDEWDWVFQSEILDAPRSSVKSLPPLEDVLKNMKVTTTTRRRREEHLSEEAGRIIDSLPILSFMTSKVLMFPLRQADD
ncbi:aftiphilin-like isoform X2 [Haliotis rufescens]|uniref:aftiphilin-like isoform X2 n=1 Tax=Haliotis rufescens TaxID=6454 RepID=UPI00201EA083|nr:aftiphilin-like isoform X2 [Haliotis rufescens]